jgi:hypothetical protein
MLLLLLLLGGLMPPSSCRLRLRPKPDSMPALLPSVASAAVFTAAVWHAASSF